MTLTKTVAKRAAYVGLAVTAYSALNAAHNSMQACMAWMNGD